MYFKHRLIEKKKKKKKKSTHKAETITDTDDIALLTNTPVQAKFLMHNLGGIGLYVNANKTVLNTEPFPLEVAGL